MKTLMASVARELGVLKIVHPGGFVELHHSPVVAQKVMAKNPRHCVTRPDVFKFPWIVVRPESLLRPGNVYLIVPYRTIHRLVRSLAAANNSPPRANNYSIAQTQQQSTTTTTTTTTPSPPPPRRRRRRVVVVVEEMMREETSNIISSSVIGRADHAPSMKSCLKKKAAGCTSTKAQGIKRVVFVSPPLTRVFFMNEYE